MDNQPTVIPESGIWSEGIYCYQNKDKMLGYDDLAHAQHDPGTLDIYNRPWIQLTNRTRYLRNLFTRAHNTDGHHSLANKDFADDILIPESYLDLDYGTADLLQQINELAKRILESVDTISNGTNGEDDYLLTAWLIQRLVPLMWYYTNTNYAFDTFTESMSLRHSIDYPLRRCVLGDDSIDVASTTGLKTGDMFVMTDPAGEIFAPVTVSEILTETRVLLTEKSTFTLSNGYLRGTNVPCADLKAKASKEFLYISDTITGFENDPGAVLRIRHTPDIGGTKQVQIYSGNSWTELPLQYTDYNIGYDEDVYNIPQLAAGFIIKAEYHDLQREATFSLLYVLSETSEDLIELVHRPTIQSITAKEAGAFTITGDYYGTLYGHKQKSMDVRTSPYRNFHSNVEVFHSDSTATQEMTITPTDKSAAYASIRYSDEEGTLSRWSKPHKLPEPLNG